MSGPSPTTPPAPEHKKPLVIASGASKREIITAVFIAAAIIGFIAFAVYHMGTERPRNNISGIVTGRSSTGERETL